MFHSKASNNHQLLYQPLPLPTQFCIAQLRCPRVSLDHGSADADAIDLLAVDVAPEAIYA